MSSWKVIKDNVRTDYIRLENLQQFLVQDVPMIHPEHPIYINFWSKEIKKCIEGMWGNEFGQYRYMPGNLYFFGNYGIINHTFQKDGVNVTKQIKPMIVDYVWDFAYMSWVAYGFSGFEKDTKTSCCVLLKQYYNKELEQKKLPQSCFHNGELKKYEDPFEYIKRLHTGKLGKPLFENPTQNALTLGSRGGGKSYWSAIAEIEYNFVFGGARRYNQAFINGEESCEQCCGAGDSNKSSEMLKKFMDSQNAKTDSESKRFKEWFGIWTDIDSKGETVTTPCPLYRRTLGKLDPSNKKNLYRAKYKVDINGEFVERGTGSTIAHVNYSTKKGDGHIAAAGGRYLYSVIEEVGGLESFIDVLGANEATVTRSGHRFGVQWAMGTSGHIEYIQATKKVFLNPQDYNVLAFKNQFGHTGKNGMIGYFIPYYITFLDCKDENGNTNYEDAINKVNRLRQKESESSDPKVLRDYMMNYPCYVDEMWLTDKGYYLPYEEAASREKELTAFDRYKLLETPVKLIWDSNVSRGVKYEILHDAEPYREFPIDSSKKKDPSGCIVIYEFPEEINGYIPHDLYQFVGLDPYVEEDIDRGGSVGSLFILINPKYIPQGFNGNCIAASYIGKPTEGLSVYYENVEKLLQFYGNPIQGLAFEKNRGESCREHFIRKNKTQLLMVTPQNTMGANIYQRNIVSFGYNVGNRIAKLNLVKMLNDWLLEETTLRDGTKRNIERIPSLFLIRQIMQYNLDDNFDAVDGFRGCILALREYETKLQSESNRKEKKSNDFKSYNNNERIFKQRKDQRFSSSSSTRIRKNL